MPSPTPLDVRPAKLSVNVEQVFCANASMSAELPSLSVPIKFPVNVPALTLQRERRCNGHSQSHLGHECDVSKDPCVRGKANTEHTHRIVS